MQAHTLYIDQLTGVARAGTTGNALPTPFAILGTTLVLKVGFLSESAPEAITNYTAGSLQASVKLKTDIDSEISLLPEGAWTVTGTGADTRYVWTVLAESGPLLTAIGGSARLDLVIGLKWGITGDANRKSFPIDLQIINSPIRSGDGSPGAVPDRYWLWLKDSLEGSENVELQYDEVEKVITIVVDVPDVAIADGDKGDVIISSGGTVWSLDDECVIESKIGPGAVTFAKMQALNASELIGRQSGSGSGVPQAITLGSGLSMSVGGVLSSSVSDGDKGDITISSGVWSLDNGVVSLAKLANLNASTLIGRQSGSTGVPQAISLGTGLSMSSGGVLSATGGGGGAAPLLTRIIYVDPAGTDPAAGIGTGTAMADFKQAYEAAFSYVVAHSGEVVTLILSAGVFTGADLPLWSPSISILGQGVDVTFITITQEDKATNHITGSGFTLSLTATMPTAGDAGTDGVDGSPEGTMGGDGSGILVTIRGRGGRIGLNELTITSAASGPGGLPYDDGVVPRNGNAGGRSGDVNCILSGIEITGGGTWQIEDGVPGAPSAGVVGGSMGDDGAHGEVFLRIGNIIQSQLPLVAGSLTVPLNAVCYGLDCQMGAVYGGDWIANGLKYLHYGLNSLSAAGGEENTPYAAGI